MVNHLILFFLITPVLFAQQIEQPKNLLELYVKHPDSAAMSGEPFQRIYVLDNGAVETNNYNYLSTFDPDIAIKIKNKLKNCKISSLIDYDLISPLIPDQDSKKYYAWVNDIKILIRAVSFGHTYINIYCNSEGLATILDGYLELSNWSR